MSEETNTGPDVPPDHLAINPSSPHFDADLLRRGVAPSDVASRVGFCDQSQMHRHFVRIVGCTPGTYAGARTRKHFVLP